MDEEAGEVIAAVCIAVALACGVIAIKNWEHIRCELPPLPSIQRQGNGPTPIKEPRL